MQAAEALRVIAGIGKPLTGRLMMLDSLHMEWTTMRIARQPDCPVCGCQQPVATDSNADNKNRTDNNTDSPPG